MIAALLLLMGLISNPAMTSDDDTDEKGLALYREAMALEGMTPPDSAAAVGLYKQSAETGFLPAMRYLGFLLYNGKGTPRDAAQGIGWLKKAAEKGDAASWENLGWIYRHGNERSDSLAFEAFTKAAVSGRPQSAFELAQMIENGIATAPDTLLAISYFEQALRGGIQEADQALAELTDWRLSTITPDSALRLSKRYFYGRAPFAATALLSKLLNSESPSEKALKAEIKTIMAQAASLGRGTDYNPHLSIGLYYEAASEGDPSAQFIISELLESYPDAIDELIDRHVTDPAEKENQKDSSYWRRLAAASGVATAEEADRRLQGL